MKLSWRALEGLFTDAVTAMRTNLHESDSRAKDSRASFAIQPDDDKSLRGRRGCGHGVRVVKRVIHT